MGTVLIGTASKTHADFIAAALQSLKFVVYVYHAQTCGVYLYNSFIEKSCRMPGHEFLSATALVLRGFLQHIQYSDCEGLCNHQSLKCKPCEGSLTIARLPCHVTIPDEREITETSAHSVSASLQKKSYYTKGQTLQRKQNRIQRL